MRIVFDIALQHHIISTPTARALSPLSGVALVRDVDRFHRLFDDQLDRLVLAIFVVSIVSSFVNRRGRRHRRRFYDGRRFQLQSRQRLRLHSHRLRRLRHGLYAR